MKGLLPLFLFNNIINKTIGLIIVDNIKQIGNLSMKLEAKPKFTSKTIQNHFKDLNFVTNSEDQVQSKHGYSKSIVIQNQCDYKNFTDEFHKAHYCPTIGSITAYELVYSNNGVYFILEGCSSYDLVEPEEFSWIITDRDEVNLLNLKISNRSTRFIFKKPISCRVVCLKFCSVNIDPIVAITVGIDDFIVITILVLFICGFLIFYPCYMFLMKFKVSNQVENFERTRQI